MRTTKNLRFVQEIIRCHASARISPFNNRPIHNAKFYHLSCWISIQNIKLDFTNVFGSASKIDRKQSFRLPSALGQLWDSSRALTESNRTRKVRMNPIICLKNVRNIITIDILSFGKIVSQSISSCMYQVSFRNSV